MNEESEIDRDDTIHGLFALITARLEDAHEPSMIGQARTANQSEMLPSLDAIASSCEEIATLKDAIRLLLCPRN